MRERTVFRCYVRTPQGQIFREPTAFATELEAAFWCGRIADDPDAFDLHDRKGQTIRASALFDEDGALVKNATLRVRADRVRTRL
jgi:hypothetical protein